MNFPEPIEELVNQMSRLPGIGRKSAWRMVHFLLNQSTERALALSDAIVELKSKIQSCTVCYNYSEEAVCPICANQNRDAKVLCVVEKQTDLYAFERGASFKGLYHVLGGALSPMDGIGPEKLHIPELLERIKNTQVEEIILATGSSMEGESTALYIDRALQGTLVKRTRLARGIPMGTDLEYIDELTLLRALEGRSQY